MSEFFVFEYFGYHQQQCATVPGGVGMLCQFLPKSRRQKSDKQPSVLAYASTLMLQQLLKGFCALFFERHPDLFILTQDYYLLDAIPVATALIIPYLQRTLFTQPPPKIQSANKQCKTFSLNLVKIYLSSNHPIIAIAN